MTYDLGNKTDGTIPQIRIHAVLNIDDMHFTILSIAFILCLYGTRADNTTDYIHQLELKISDLESHSLASEEKQAAVLSSILSRLQSQEKKMQELETELENATKNDCSSVSSSGLQPIIFEAKTSHDFNARTRIHFDQISTNVGGAYSSTTDVFTAPKNGTYQIWFNVNLDLNYSGGQGPVLRVAGGAGPTIYGSYIAPDQKLHTSYQHYKVLQGVLAVSLLQGDPVYLTLGPSKLYPYTKIKSASTFGGVLLGDM